MANKFRVNTLLLTSQSVQASGDTLVVNSTPLVKSSDTGSFITNGQTGIFITAGQTGQFYPNSNPSGYISSAPGGGGVETINVTGSLISGALTYTGAGNVSITKSGQLITWSGDTSLLATAANLVSTGSNLQSQINTVTSWTGTTTGLYYPYSSNPAGYLTSAGPGGGGVTGISVTGDAPITGLATLTGIGGLTITQNGNVISFSGGAGGGEVNTASNLGDGSGLFFDKNVFDLRFKSLQAGNNIQITGDNDKLDISVVSLSFTKGGTFYNPDGVPSGEKFIPLWFSPFSCSATAVRGYILSGTNATINAYKNSVNTDLLATDLLISTTGAWTSSETLQNNTFVSGDTFGITLIQNTGNPVSITVQVDFVRT